MTVGGRTGAQSAGRGRRRARAGCRVASRTRRRPGRGNLPVPPDPLHWSASRTSNSAASPVRGDRLNGVRGHADRSRMARTRDLHRRAARPRAHARGRARHRPGTWYLRVLDESRADDVEADLGALVRAYWELQRDHRQGRSARRVAVARRPSLAGRLRV